MIYLALTVALSVAANYPIYRMLTSEDRAARLRAPAVVAEVPLIPYNDHIGLV